MNQTNTFLSVLVIPSSLKNDDLISVNFTINFPSSSPAPSTLTIVFPSDLDISSASCDLTCTKISNNISFNILTWSSTFTTTISNVLNAPSFKPIGDFIFHLSNTNDFESLNQIKSAWTNNLASSFTTNVNVVNAYRGENALFKFNIASLSAKQTYIIIKFNDLYGSLSTAPSGGSLIGPRTVRYNILNQSSADFSITLQTPVVFGDYSFST